MGRPAKGCLSSFEPIVVQKIYQLKVVPSGLGFQDHLFRTIWRFGIEQSFNSQTNFFLCFSFFLMGQENSFEIYGSTNYSGFTNSIIGYDKTFSYGFGIGYNADLELGVKYFTQGASVFTAGATYFIGHRFEPAFNYRFASSSLDFFLRHEFFFVRNISFNTTLTHNRTGRHGGSDGILILPGNEGPSNWRLSFGFSYFMFNGNCSTKQN